MASEKEFEHLPNRIQAVQWFGDEHDISDFITAELFNISDSGAKLFIETLEGCMEANVLDWIIRGVAGEYYACKPDIFEKNYRPIPSPSSSVEGAPELLPPTLMDELERLYRRSPSQFRALLQAEILRAAERIAARDSNDAELAGTEDGMERFKRINRELGKLNHGAAEAGVEVEREEFREWWDAEGRQIRALNYAAAWICWQAARASRREEK